MSAPISYRQLRAGDQFALYMDGPVFVRCRGGFRPGRGGPLHRLVPTQPVYRVGAA